MRNRTPKMLIFPGLGSDVEVSQSRQKLRMSVEQDTLSANRRQVNIFLGLYSSLPYGRGRAKNSHVGRATGANLNVIGSGLPRPSRLRFRSHSSGTTRRTAYYRRIAYYQRTASIGVRKAADTISSKLSA